MGKAGRCPCHWHHLGLMLRMGQSCHRLQAVLVVPHVGAQVVALARTDMCVAGRCSRRWHHLGLRPREGQSCHRLQVVLVIPPVGAARWFGYLRVVTSYYQTPEDWTSEIGSLPRCGRRMVSEMLDGWILDHRRGFGSHLADGLHRWAIDPCQGLPSVRCLVGVSELVVAASRGRIQVVSRCQKGPRSLP